LAHGVKDLQTSLAVGMWQCQRTAQVQKAGATLRARYSSAFLSPVKLCLYTTTTKLWKRTHTCVFAEGCSAKMGRTTELIVATHRDPRQGPSHTGTIYLELNVRKFGKCLCWVSP